MALWLSIFYQRRLPPRNVVYRMTLIPWSMIRFERWEYRLTRTIPRSNVSNPIALNSNTWQQKTAQSRIIHVWFFITRAIVRISTGHRILTTTDHIKVIHVSITKSYPVLTTGVRDKKAKMSSFAQISLSPCAFAVRISQCFDIKMVDVMNPDAYMVQWYILNTFAGFIN
jgi:hypothetical protein